MFSFNIIEQDEDVVEFTITGADGTLTVITGWRKEGDTLILDQLHLDGLDPVSSALPVCCRSSENWGGSRASGLLLLTAPCEPRELILGTNLTQFVSLWSDYDEQSHLSWLETRA
jgi:hypothetical protein